MNRATATVRPPTPIKGEHLIGSITPVYPLANATNDANRGMVGRFLHTLSGAPLREHDEYTKELTGKVHESMRKVEGLRRLHDKRIANWGSPQDYGIAAKELQRVGNHPALHERDFLLRQRISARDLMTRKRLAHALKQDRQFDTQLTEALNARQGIVDKIRKTRIGAGIAGAGLLAAGAYGLKKYMDHRNHKEEANKEAMYAGFADGMKEAADAMMDPRNSQIGRMAAIGTSLGLAGYALHDGLKSRAAQHAEILSALKRI